MTMHWIADRAERIEPSATLAVAAKAAALKRAGADIINLSTGEPDFDTPDFIKEAAIQAIREGQTKYTAVEGTLALREAVAHKFQRDQQISYSPKEILISSGAKQSLFNLFQAVLNQGDEVIIPLPAWVSYVDMAKVCDATPVTLQTRPEDHFKLTPQALQNAITPHTKLLILNSPNNPTGVVYHKHELIALGEVLKKHPQVLIASDDIYEHIYWGTEPYCAFITANPDLRDRTIVINGASKAYAMTGWRIGYAAGPENLIQTMTKLQSQSTTSACTISQAAALTALSAPQDFLKPMVEAFTARYTYVYQRLQNMAHLGIECYPSEGAFYAFFRVATACERLQLPNDIACAEFLLDQAHVAVVPGTAFGGPGFLRASFATSMAQLEQGFDRLEKAFALS